MKLVVWIRAACFAVAAVAMLAPIPFQAWQEVDLVISFGHAHSSASVYNHELTYLQAVATHEGEWLWIAFWVLCGAFLAWEHLEKRPRKLWIYTRAASLLFALGFTMARNIIQIFDTRESMIAEYILLGAALVFIGATVAYGVKLPKRAATSGT